jgi:hypothetical protein
MLDDASLACALLTPRSRLVCATLAATLAQTFVHALDASSFERGEEEGLLTISGGSAPLFF